MHIWVYPPKNFLAQSACGPITAIFFTSDFIGNTPLFFRSTSDSFADCKDTSLSVFWENTPFNSSPCRENGCSNKPIRNFAVSTRNTARLSTLISAFPVRNFSRNFSPNPLGFGSSISIPAFRQSIPASSNVSPTCWEP